MCSITEITVSRFFGTHYMYDQHWSHNCFVYVSVISQKIDSGPKVKPSHSLVIRA